MISLRKEKKKIIATYYTSRESNSWVHEKFEKGGEYAFNKTFNFSKKNLYITGKTIETIEDIFDEPEPIDFIFAELTGEYYKIVKGVIAKEIEIFFHKEIKLSTDFFLAENDISIFKKIEPLVDENIFIGGNNKNAIAIEIFSSIISEFPNAYEKKLYADAKISSLIKELFTTTKDIEQKFEKYLNKKISVKGQDLLKAFQDFEVLKYQTIYEKLLAMLNNEINYSEIQWQQEILQIVLLLYPKYIFVFKEVPISADDVKNKYIDFLLVDSDGNTDIIEIKKPFENSTMTKGHYRDNYIPLRELTGTVMQIEKYIYFLNRWSLKGEVFLTKKYADILPADFKIKITNPSGIIIMGRENNLNSDQRRDFEVVKRKYKNVMDIITYDNLIERLRLTIEQIKKI